MLVLGAALALRGALVTRQRGTTLRRVVEPAPRTAKRTRSRPLTRKAGGTLGARDGALVARAMAQALRAGHSPAQALVHGGEAVPGHELHLVAQVAATGGLRRACEEWRRRDGSVSVRLITAALATGAAAGGPLARALDGVADTIDARAAIEREAWAQSATARASAAVLVVAPVAFAVAATTADGKAVRFLTGTPAGLACLVTAVALNAAGTFWMSRITSSSPRGVGARP